MIESGFPDFTVPAMFGVVAPAGTPRPVVDKLNAAINRELSSAEMRKVLSNMGAESGFGSPDDYSDFIAAEKRKWEAVAKAANLRID